MLRLKLGLYIGYILLLAIHPTHAQSSVPPSNVTCEALLPPDRPMFSGPNAPTIRFSAPASGDVYGTFVTVSVDIEHFDLTTDARHWHLWVNGQLQGMVYQPSTILDLAPGRYQLCASLGDSDHADIGQPAETVITVYAAAAGTPTTAPAAPLGPVGEVIPESGVTPGKIALVVAVGLLAAVGGWWLGARLPKAQK